MGVKPLAAPYGSSTNKQIVGRGRSSGAGKTSGRGHKGQNARSGGGVRLGFEGGQMPIYRRVASRGFSNHPFKKAYTVVNLSSLEKFYTDDEVVSIATLVEKRLLKRSEVRVKILGDGKLTRKLEVRILNVSAHAKELIEKVGGSVLPALPEKGIDGK